MPRKLELIWAGLFILLSAGTISQIFSWTLVFIVSLALSIVLAIVEMRSVSYHGVGWQRLNPGLPQWWEQQKNRELG